MSFCTMNFNKTLYLFQSSNGTDRSLRAASDSILNFMDLAFAKSGGNPNITQIAQTIIRAAKNDSLPFKIFLTNFIVDGTGEYYIPVLCKQ